MCRRRVFVKMCTFKTSYITFKLIEIFWIFLKSFWLKLFICILILIFAQAKIAYVGHLLFFALTNIGLKILITLQKSAIMWIWTPIFFSLIEQLIMRISTSLTQKRQKVDFRGLSSKVQNCSRKKQIVINCRFWLIREWTLATLYTELNWTETKLHR